MQAIAHAPPPPLTVARARDEARHRQLAAARAGDRASMRAIYEAEAPRLLRRLRHLTGDLARAQDLTHDVFVVAFSGRAAFDGQASLATWLYGVALNKWRNESRKAARRRAILAARREPSGPKATASDALVLDELSRQLDEALAALPLNLREAFVLRVLEDLPLREAASVAGVSQTTMSKRARKAEARIRAALEPRETQA